VILRIWRPYGPGQGGSFLIPRLAQRIREAQPITLFQGGRPRANTIYIAELMEVIQRGLRIEHSVTLNVAHPDAPSIFELCEALAEIVGRPAEYQWRDETAGDLVADVTRMERVLGFRATVGLVEGLRRMFGSAA
jgi:nucleoside-diphosphate-sugar epimerase